MAPTQSISINQGSAQLHTLEVGGFRITDAIFPPSLTLPSHYHQWACFAVVLAGSVDKKFPKKEYASPHSTIVTMPPLERHLDQFEQAGAHMLVVEPTQTDDALLAPCLNLFNQVNHFRDATMTNIARRISQELQTPDVASALAVNGLVLELLSEAVRKASPASQTAAYKQPPIWLNQAKELIHERFRDSLTVAMLATAVNVHPVHLARTFRTCYGVTIGSYVRQLRLNWAITQITHSQKPLAMIAAQAGFSDQSHLTRVFTQHKGITPGQYRQQIQIKKLL
ncbi:helix-turn-helix domain-containing protein [Candidatus Leptofilum sp.]|uniref:helix-turn-helix domain-containing protein n=1 Tax=Candidatus Leptofilum sp. TaxID=3241576 RepID=UPI003B5CB8AC